MPGHREFKDALYAQFARIGHALASPKRIELLDLLGQGEKTVEALAEHVATPVKNTSAHLRVLRQARLVETRRDGTYVYYRLADDDVFRLLRTLETIGHSRLGRRSERRVWRSIESRTAPKTSFWRWSNAPFPTRTGLAPA